MAVEIVILTSFVSIRLDPRVSTLYSAGSPFQLLRDSRRIKGFVVYHVNLSHRIPRDS